MLPAQLNRLRLLGEETTAGANELVRNRLLAELRRSLGAGTGPPPRCDDPAEAYFHPDSITRRIHGDLPSMLIGGLAALLFQMLHPLAMAGVADHSNFRDDPLGRLGRTSTFLGTTTFGSKSAAEKSIATVRRIHRSVVGTAPDGRPYAASDPELLTWVHACEVRSFVTASLIYGPKPLSRTEQDQYLGEIARVPLALGCIEVPTNLSELDEYFGSVRPELRLTRQARVARNFVLRGVSHRPHEITTYSLLITAAQGSLPPWARRQLHLPTLPGVDRLAVRPAARGLNMALRWVASAPSPVVVPPAP